MKIKILSFTQRWNEEDCGYNKIIENISEWSEVTEDEYDILCTWIENINNANTTKYMIVAQPIIDLPLTINNILEKAKVELAKKEEYKKKCHEKNQKRLETLKKKKEEKELRQLEKLKQKYNNISSS
jgi:hypothetical protein